ncbi:MAG: tail fiber domain-containing protein, partial [Proteobacteria bacterium]|nr:tail fiber domain-containing protein [Pseudomonadota bacterium]
MYGLLLPAPTSVVGLIVNNNWGIRQEWSSANNWFAGISNQFPNITTTASAANAFLDSANSNRLFRSTSSIVYKTNIETLNSEYADRIFKLRPVWYRSKCIDDRKDWSWYGLIAEEVAEIEPRLVHY